MKKLLAGMICGISVLFSAVAEKITVEQFFQKYNAGEKIPAGTELDVKKDDSNEIKFHFSEKFKTEVSSLTKNDFALLSEGMDYRYEYLDNNSLFGEKLSVIPIKNAPSKVYLITAISERAHESTSLVMKNPDWKVIMYVQNAGTTYLAEENFFSELFSVDGVTYLLESKTVQGWFNYVYFEIYDITYNKNTGMVDKNIIGRFERNRSDKFLLKETAVNPAAANNSKNEWKKYISGAALSSWENQNYHADSLSNGSNVHCYQHVFNGNKTVKVVEYAGEGAPQIADILINGKSTGIAEEDLTLNGQFGLWKTNISFYNHNGPKILFKWSESDSDTDGYSVFDVDMCKVVYRYLGPKITLEALDLSNLYPHIETQGNGEAIYILGSSADGKFCYAKKTSASSGYPMYEIIIQDLVTDDIIWSKKDGGKKGNSRVTLADLIKSQEFQQQYKKYKLEYADFEVEKGPIISDGEDPSMVWRIDFSIEKNSRKADGKNSFHDYKCIAQKNGSKKVLTSAKNVLAEDIFIKGWVRSSSRTAVFIGTKKADSAGKSGTFYSVTGCNLYARF